MLDRKSKYPGRVRVDYVEQGDGYAIVDVTRADEAETEGTLLGKNTILPDSVAEALGLPPESATPADAFRTLAKNLPPEIIAIAVTENENLSVVKFIYSDATLDIIKSNFDDNGALSSLSVNDRNMDVLWQGNFGGDESG